jgi:hypothetical protein
MLQTHLLNTGPRVLALGQLAIGFLQWWDRGRGPVGQMPHQSIVLKNALTSHGK